MSFIRAVFYWIQFNPLRRWLSEFVRCAMRCSMHCGCRALQNFCRGSRQRRERGRWAGGAIRICAIWAVASTCHNTSCTSSPTLMSTRTAGPLAMRRRKRKIRPKSWWKRRATFWARRPSRKVWSASCAIRALAFSCVCFFGQSQREWLRFWILPRDLMNHPYSSRWLIRAPRWTARPLSWVNSGGVNLKSSPELVSGRGDMCVAACVVVTCLAISGMWLFIKFVNNNIQIEINIKITIQIKI